MSAPKLSQPVPTPTGQKPALASTGQKPAQAMPSKEIRRRFGAGETIFQQGDPGGDLLFIEDGVVEIYQTNGDETVVLSEMRAGEIIGVLTCMTKEKRMASARAKTDVLCKRVPHEAVGKVLQTLPNWMKIVLKEFTIRLTHMNRLYTEANAKIKAMEQTQISSVYLSSLIASAFAGTAELMAIATDAGKIVFIDDVLQKLEGMLNLKREDMDPIWKCMLQSNLLKIEIDPEKKREMTRLENARKLSFFAQFVRESRYGAAKRLLKARFANKETRVLAGLVRYAQRLEMDLNKVCRLPVKDLAEALERKTGVKWERDAIQKGLDLKLLALEGPVNEEVVVFRPSEMGRTVACVEAIRRLKKLDMGLSPEDEGEGGRE